MPLTRHLYREDEVQAALMYCILRGRVTEVTFWALELLDSQLLDKYLKSMYRIWLYGFGIKALGWFCAFVAFSCGDELDVDTCLEFAYSLSCLAVRNAKDSSILMILGTKENLQGDTGPPDRVGTKREGAETELEGFVVAALMQGKAPTGWLGIHALQATEQEKVLSRVLVTKHGDKGASPLYSLFRAEADGYLNRQEALAVTVGACCLSSDDYAKSCAQALPPPPPNILECVANWKVAVGRRSRRAMAVPLECLYWITQRGREQSVYDSNEKDIMGSLEKYGGALWESEFWDMVADEMGGWEAVRSDAATRESFYDTYFPDDIPDEWSKKERAKSHGQGVLQRGAKATETEWVRRWFFTAAVPSAILWNNDGGGHYRAEDDPQPPTVTPAKWNLKPVLQTQIVVVGEEWAKRVTCKKV